MHVYEANATRPFMALFKAPAWAAAALVALAAGAMPPARAADAKQPDSAQSRYERERARCLSGRSQEDQATCLKEAGAARQERKEGKLQGTPSSPAVLERNAMQRCLNLPDKDRADCESRVKGQGIKEGSVRGGGTVTETVTTHVLPPGSQVPPDEKQIGTVPIVVPPPVFSSSPSR